ncbi:Paraquat-inducible protein A [Poseidonocella pacifica]|uniref:Paraquat-inducible protein A n=1 Tax=Poseidonocella pacifica TaxID=871651 RepID=A0A1I0V6M7_9RHOB|nr:paraquat-inducible protein A [Poseidonocella pacifica]SFA71707.1 Paraquat-inducible protein A [Poseidonocella pacifica]
MTRGALFWANLALLVLFPLSWCAPLLRAGLLPIFGMAEISVMSGLHSLWGTEPVLAALVGVFALLAPMAKTFGLILVHAGRAPHLLPLASALGRLAMADIFLIALYITLAKGIGVGRVETAWGLWLFTGCILASLVISRLTAREMRG